MLLLDEIGCLALTLQPKLLRVLQELEFTRVGGSKSIPSRPGWSAPPIDICWKLSNSARSARTCTIGSASLKSTFLRSRAEGRNLRDLANRFAQELGLKLEREALAVLESYSFPGMSGNCWALSARPARSARQKTSARWTCPARSCRSVRTRFAMREYHLARTVVRDAASTSDAQNRVAFQPSVSGRTWVRPAVTGSGPRKPSG